MDFESELTSTLDHLLKRTAPPCPPNLAAAIRYSLLAPGKRIRPRLALACGKMLALDERAAYCAAAAIEMIHCFTLIHDDLPCMDDDDFRRGRPANHKAHGEAMALLAGDGLISLAFEVLLEAPHVPPACLMAAVRTLTHASGPRGVIGGQAAESLLGETSCFAELESMHALKTGALFTASLVMPADLAGVDPNGAAGKAIHEFSSALGLAFQALDDLDDAEQDRKSGVTAPPTQILRYMSESDARGHSRRRLSASLPLIHAEFGDAARTLSEIANEVLGKL